jgi:hypothetical protein
MFTSPHLFLFYRSIVILKPQGRESEARARESLQDECGQDHRKTSPDDFRAEGGGAPVFVVSGSASAAARVTMRACRQPMRKNVRPGRKRIPCPDGPADPTGMRAASGTQKAGPGWRPG